MAPHDSQALALRSRQSSLLDAIASAERRIDLKHRQLSLLDAVARLESRIISNISNDDDDPTTTATTTQPSLPEDASETHKRIHESLVRHHPDTISSFRVVRVPSDYYDRPLEYRRANLSASSVAHLCKSMVMENTKDDRPYPEGLPTTTASGPWDSKYVMVVVQYVSKLHAEKIRDLVFDRRQGRTPRKKIKFRLAPEEVSRAITGYGHNAVTPVATARAIPVLVSHRILDLRPDFFFLGAGEVDLKVGFSAAEFVEAYCAHVLDCTYD